MREPMWNLFLSLSNYSRIFSIIEVGSYKGLSTVSLGKTCKKLQELYKKSCTVIAVDTWLGTSEHYEVPEWFDDFSKKE